MTTKSKMIANYRDIGIKRQKSVSVLDQEICQTVPVYSSMEL